MKNISFFGIVGIALLLASCGSPGAPETPGGDTVKPTVSLTASPGSLSASGAVQLKASASDNVGVTSVKFYQGATLLSEDTAAPYETSVNVTVVGDATVAFRAVASDAAGNTAEATANVTTKATATPITQIQATVRVAQNKTDGDGNGVIVTRAWDLGPGDLRMVTLAVPGGDPIEVARTPLAADGRFTFNLPVPSVTYTTFKVEDDLFCSSGATITKSVSVSDPLTKADKYNVIFADRRNNPNAPPGPFERSTTTPAGYTSKTGQLFYVDRPTTVKGAIVCKYASGTVYTYNYDYDFKKGWNTTQRIETVVLNGKGSILSSTYTYRSAPFSSTWLYFPLS